MGETPLEQAKIEMWQRQVEFGLFMQIGMCFQHSTGYFKDRMTPVPEYGTVAGQTAKGYLKLLEKRFSNSANLLKNNFYSVSCMN